MEQHSIPRNITGFQFKLIGDMTLRQFGYLASGCIVGYSLFKLLPLPFIINIAIGGFIAFLGFAFAFLPFQDRPLDQWLLAFVKSVSSPTQFVFHKINAPLDILTQTPMASTKISGYHGQQLIDSKKLLEAYLVKLPKKTTDSLDQNERIALSQTLSLFTTVPQPQPTVMVKRTIPPAPAVKPPPTPPAVLEAKKPKLQPPPVHPVKKETENIKNPVSNKNEVKGLTDELSKLREQIKTGFSTKTNDPLLEKRFLELEQKLTTLLTEREKLTAELIGLRQNKSFAGKTVQPQTAKEEVASQPSVKMISQQQATKVGILNPPSTPNLVIGIVKDQNGATIPNILITVKDMRGNPLRALKTNNLGQFFASTPLTSGTYVLEVEDPQKKFAFDLIELKLNNIIVQPLEISAKKQVDPVREKLAKELFQKTFS